MTGCHCPGDVNGYLESTAVLVLVLGCIGHSWRPMAALNDVAVVDEKLEEEDGGRKMMHTLLRSLADGTVNYA